MNNTWYIKNPWKYQRAESNLVKVGKMEMGLLNPVRVQSMANTPTHNVEESVHQAIEIIEAGGELIRFTVIDLKDAEALKDIKSQLVAKGYETPIVADVHFNPNLADTAAKYIDKVRINPGNYIDKRATFQQVEYTDEEYALELEKLNERFCRFLDICNKHNTAIRIGTNHGSLSDRIMSRYGDTPYGMVEATMEFLRICKTQNFTNVAVSLKSSNTRVMVQAYRLLSQQMQLEQMAFALHLGVTEAGSGEDGRIKSAVGIGALMHDGLGDTIRVSLTEHPAKEIPVTKTLVQHFEQLSNCADIDYNEAPVYNPYGYEPRKARSLMNSKLPIVIGDLSADGDVNKAILESLHFIFDQETKTILKGDLAPDIIYTGEQMFQFAVPANTTILTDCNYWDERTNSVPLFAWNEYLVADKKSDKQNWVQMQLADLNDEAIELLKTDQSIVVVCCSYGKNPTMEKRAFINSLMHNNCEVPVVIQHTYNEFSLADFQLKSAADNGLFFIDGLSNGLWLKSTFKTTVAEPVEAAFAILQASRSRVTKTEYISCPGCGRTLFDLEKTLAEVKESTQELKGLKIAVMGCIVNGPGEMADADYGYVGAGAGKVSLYKGKELVKRNINTSEAVSELLSLIEKNKY